MSTVTDNWYLSGELYIGNETSDRPDNDIWRDHFGHSNVWGKFTKIAATQLWGLQNSYGILQNWDSDSLFIGLKDEGPDRKDAVIAFGDGQDDSLRFLFTGAGAPPPEPKELLRITSGGSIGIGTIDVKRTLHVEGNEIHSGGGAGGFSFGDRGAPFVENPSTSGKRWVWYSADGIARLWSGVDKLNVTPTGNLSIVGDIAIGGKHALRGNDNWLRLNQERLFSKGVHTPGLFFPGSLNVGGENDPGFGNALFTGNVVIGAGGNASLKIRHIDGKHYQNDQPDGLHLNWSNGQPVHVGGEGGDGKESNLHVHGNIFWKSDRSDINFIRLGNLLICWGGLTIPVFDRRTNQWETQNQVNFPTQFSVTPTVTISLSDPGIGRDVADTVVGSYQVTNSGFIVLTKRIPLIAYDPREGHIIINWIAIGR